MPDKIASTHILLERSLVIYQRERSDVWQCRYKVDGKWQRASTKERKLSKAKEAAKTLLSGIYAIHPMDREASHILCRVNNRGRQL